MNTLPVAGRRWRCLLIPFAALALIDAATAGSSLRPRVAFFASVAKAAEFDPLAAGDTLRPTERAFLRQALEVTRQQRALAQVGTAQATSSDLRSFAQQLASDTRQLADSIEGVARKKGVVLMP